MTIKELDLLGEAADKAIADFSKRLDEYNSSQQRLREHRLFASTIEQMPRSVDRRSLFETKIKTRIIKNDIDSALFGVLELGQIVVDAWKRIKEGKAS